MGCSNRLFFRVIVVYDVNVLMIGFSFGLKGMIFWVNVLWVLINCMILIIFCLWFINGIFRKDWEVYLCC